ncbi:MAG: NAD(P)-dependent dehydrogenase (short-subunit alcohol dehydrogenase family) [Gammaproteobacteria bacterium]|jgi:NAD(P)-dependent dehydrogenase (short-subunit alcohol dehydrogenase family)
MTSNQSSTLQGKVVLVTAGGSGIGRTIVESYLAQGARVHTCDVSQSMLDDSRANNPNLTTSLCDVSDAAQVGALFDDVKQHYGRLDVLVNNAGVSGATAAIEEVEIEDWDRTLAVDLRGTFLVTRLGVPMLKQAGGGSIINMSSNAGLFGTPLRSPYAASKWAVIGLTKTWAMELGPFDIRVNAICPGCVDGPRIDGVIERDAKERGMQPEEIRNVYQRQSSLRKFVSAQDIANMAIFISSDLGASISGQALSVDGHTEGLSNWLD